MKIDITTTLNDGRPAIVRIHIAEIVNTKVFSKTIGRPAPEARNPLFGTFVALAKEALS